MIDLERKERLKSASLEVLTKNRRTTEGFQYTVPSPSTYPYQWLWDSCFHAIVLSHFDPEDAKQEIRSLFSKQFENGMLPHMIYWEPADFVDIPWGTEKTSSITQPPIIALSVWEIFLRDRDETFLREAYPHLKRFYDFLLNDRDPRGEHLSSIINPDESGEDNSPRFDLPLKLPFKQTLQLSLETRIKLVEQLQLAKFNSREFMKKFFWVADVPFNALLVQNLRIVAMIASRVGREIDAAAYGAHAEEIALAMRHFMLEDGIYWSTYGEGHTKIKLRTWAIFAPLCAHLLSQDEARDLVERELLNKSRFATRFMVPTVSCDEESFDELGFWRGPTWIGTNWFLYRALRDYGFDEEAERIMDASVTLLERSGFREYFSPHTGAGGGAIDFTWGALVVDMFAYEPLKDIDFKP